MIKNFISYNIWGTTYGAWNDHVKWDLIKEIDNLQVCGKIIHAKRECLCVYVYVCVIEMEELKRNVIYLDAFDEEESFL